MHAALTITPEQKAAALDLSAFTLKAYLYKQNMRLKYERLRMCLHKVQVDMVQKHRRTMS